MLKVTPKPLVRQYHGCDIVSIEAPEPVIGPIPDPDDDTKTIEGRIDDGYIHQVRLQGNPAGEFVTLGLAIAAAKKIGSEIKNGV